MGALDKLKSLISTPDTEKLQQEAYSAGQDNPRIIPTSPAESAQTLQMLGQTNNSTFELGQLALDPDEDIEQLKSWLRGYKIEAVEDNKGNVTLKKIQTGAKLMNDEGTNAVAGHIRIYFSKTFILTNYTSGGAGDGNKTDAAIAVIRKRCMYACLNLIPPLTFKRREWEIDEANRALILDTITNMIEASLLRSLDDGERKKYYNTQKTVQHLNQQQNMNDLGKKKGILGF